MVDLAIIGGTGLTRLNGLNLIEKRKVLTPFGSPSSDILIGSMGDISVCFLARHGQNHTIAPHQINYRANIWALHCQGVKNIIAVAAVGGIGDLFAPGVLAIPDQLIDYSYGREQSFFSDDFTAERHLDFSYPYDHELRQRLLRSAAKIDLPMIDGGTYGVTQGPRLETVAEIRKMKREGCDMVGMTAMPEAYLARELAMNYASCALIVNWAAGLGEGVITMADMEHTRDQGMVKIERIITELIQTQ